VNTETTRRNATATPNQTVLMCLVTTEEKTHSEWNECNKVFKRFAYKKWGFW